MLQLSKEGINLNLTSNNFITQPFLKWAGGKRQLLPYIIKHLPRSINTYYEPFVGAGALLFHLQPKKAVINDINSELINCYNVIKDLSIDLIDDLKKHKNQKDYFYEIRSLDRTSNFETLSMVERASRIIFLNKTCYNGLFRVNKQDQYNAPYGNYKNPNIVNDKVILSINKYFNINDVEIKNTDFSTAVEGARKGDFIYMDPPYDPISDTASFTGYNFNKFGKAEQIRIKDLFDKLTLKGCSVMLSNSSTKFINDLYSDYNIIKLQANRNINSKGSQRGKIEELLILNY